MSASRDNTQKATFVYTNLYALYRKGKDAAQQAPDAPQQEEVEAAPFVARPAGTHVLKAEALKSSAEPRPRIEAFTPPSFIGKRVDRPEYLAPQRNEALESLKENLKTLNDLHSRLRFMLQELEELVK